MFNGKYKAITLKQFGDFIEGKYEYPELVFFTVNNGEEVCLSSAANLKKAVSMP